jgi:hypothetical protein
MKDTIKKATRHVNQNEGLIFEKSSAGKVAWKLPPLDVPQVDASALLGAAERKDLGNMPEVSEIEIIDCVCGVFVADKDGDTVDDIEGGTDDESVLINIINFSCCSCWLCWYKEIPVIPQIRTTKNPVKNPLRYP